MRSITNDDDIIWRKVTREPLDTGAHQLRPVKAFLPEGAVPKVLANAVLLELHPRCLAEVAGCKSQADAVALLKGFQQVGEPGLQMTVAFF